MSVGCIVNTYLLQDRPGDSTDFDLHLRETHKTRSVFKQKEQPTRSAWAKMSTDIKFGELSPPVRPSARPSMMRQMWQVMAMMILTIAIVGHR